MGATVALATLYIVFGALLALLGLKIFKILLPIAGLFLGMAVGYQGVVGVFGQGVFSFTSGIITAFLVGILFALLSYFFFELAVMLAAAGIGATAMAYLGIVLGLSADGFLVTLMAIGGGVFAAFLVATFGLSRELVSVVTSFVGVGLVLIGIFLIFTDLTIEEIYNQGLGRTFNEFVSDSLVWFLLWFGGSLVASLIQTSIDSIEFMENRYAYIDSDKVK